MILVKITEAINNNTFYINPDSIVRVLPHYNGNFDIQLTTDIALHFVISKSEFDKLINAASIKIID